MATNADGSERAVIAKAIRWNETHNPSDESELALSTAVEALVQTGDQAQWARVVRNYEDPRPAVEAAGALTCGVCLEARAVNFFSVRKAEDDRFFIHNRPACGKCMRAARMLLGPVDEVELFEGRMA